MAGLSSYISPSGDGSTRRRTWSPAKITTRAWSSVKYEHYARKMEFPSSTSLENSKRQDIPAASGMRVATTTTLKAMRLSRALSSRGWRRIGFKLEDINARVAELSREPASVQSLVELPDRNEITARDSRTHHVVHLRAPG